MTTTSRTDGPSLGFLTVIEHAEQGLFGGYLVLNCVGRPLEFHCTAPVKANRAQQILYGPTLRPFLYGEQIAQTLVGRSRIRPAAIFTDQAAVLAVRPFVEPPVALVLGPDDGDGGERPAFDAVSGPRLGAGSGDGPFSVFPLGPNRLAVPEVHREDRPRLAERLGGLAESFDLAEPFGRIREAIEEARRGAA